MIPFLFVILYGGFEWSQIFVKHVRASTIGREAALAAHHDCKDLNKPPAIAPAVDAPPAPPKESVQDCVNRVRSEMMGKAALVLPNFMEKGEIIITFYGNETASAGGGGDYTSHYSSGTIEPSLLALLDTVVVGEVFYENELLTPIEGLIEFIMPRVIYKSTFV